MQLFNYYKDYFKKKNIKKKLKKILKKIEIPVLICSFNRLYYLKRIIRQFNKLSIKPIILDNNSNNKNLLKFYKNNKKSFFNFLFKLISGSVYANILGKLSYINFSYITL